MTAPDRPEADVPPARAVRQRSWRRRSLQALAIIVVLVALWDLGLRFVAPKLARDAIVDGLVEATGRPARLDRVEIDPWALVFRMHGLELGEPHDGSDGTAARSHLRLARLEADLSWRSLRHLAPVLERLRIEEPRIFIARSAEGVYDGTDLVDAFGAQEPQPVQEDEDPAPAKFSIANIELIDGNVVVDDRLLDLRHQATGIGLRVPFLSSLPVDQQIEVEPGFEAVVDGTPIRAVGRMLPFAPVPAGEVELSIEALDLPRWLAYLPQEPPIRLVSGALAGDLKLSFSAPRDSPARLSATGQAALGGIEIRQPDDRPLLKLPALEASGIAFDLSGPSLAIGLIAADRPELVIARKPDEAGFLEPVMKAIAKSPQQSRQSERAASAEPTEQTGQTDHAGSDEGSTPSVAAGSADTVSPNSTPSAPADAARFAWSIETAVVTNGQLLFDDQAFAPRPLQIRLDELAIELSGLALPSAQPARLTLSTRAEGGERIDANAEIDLEPLTVAGEVGLAEVPLASWSWLAGPALALETKAGALAAGTRFALAEDGNWTLADGRVAVNGLALADQGRDVVRVDSLELAGLRLDAKAQQIDVGRAALAGGRLALRRLADRQLDASGWWRADPGGEAAADAAWQGAIETVSVSGLDVDLTYAGTGERHPPLRVNGITVDAADITLDGATPVQLSLSAQVDRSGSVSARGTVTPAARELSLALQAKALPVAVAQPWMPPDFNAELANGALSIDGRLQLSVDADGRPDGQWQGAVNAADFRLRLKREAVAAIPARQRRSGADPADLLGWKSLRLGSTKVMLAPFLADLGDIELDGLQSRLVIQPNGRFNLQGLFGTDPDEDADGNDEAQADGRQAQANAAAGSGTASGAAAAAQSPDGVTPRADDGPQMSMAEQKPVRIEAPPKSDPPPFRTGRVRLSDGNIDFSDYFIQPNYSANLTGLAGEIGAMGGGQPADLQLDGRIDNTGAVTISGRIDPIGAPLFLDIEANARDFDLPTLSPYSAKYVGYGIEKGKLSVDVAYQVQNGQLVARNRIVLDQLTFGEPVDSPDALQLPVLFAVSLLKDRDGVIDVDLPISGSLDDPEFSVAGIVLRLIGNLIVKAVTAPFALIAGLVDGEAEELSVLPFGAAQAELDDTVRERLGTLARALSERPGLQLDIGGRWLEADREALRRAQLESRLKRIRRALDGTGFQQPISDAQRPVLVTQAWLMVQTPAPLEKDRPAIDAMERALIDSIVLAEEPLQQLAGRRAQAVKDWLAGEGGIDPARLFVTAAKAGDGEAGVELTLK